MRLVELHAPFQLEERRTYRDILWRVMPDFQRGKDAPLCAAVEGRLVRDVKILNCAIEGWDSWQTTWKKPDNSSLDQMNGLELNGCDDATVEGLRIRGFPRNGIHLVGCWSPRLRWIDISLCLYGINFQTGWPSLDGRWNQAAEVEHFYPHDLWADPTSANIPVTTRHGKVIHKRGGDGLVGVVGGLRASHILGSGDALAMVKLSGPGLDLSDFNVPSMMLVGNDPLNAAFPNPYTRNIVGLRLRDFALVEQANGAPTSWLLVCDQPLDDNEIRGGVFTVWNPKSGAVSLQSGFAANFVDCDFIGFPGDDWSRAVHIVSGASAPSLLTNNNRIWAS